MTSYYTYNVFPYGTYEISAAILLQYNNNTVYPDITNLIKTIFEVAHSIIGIPILHGAFRSLTIYRGHIL